MHLLDTDILSLLLRGHARVSERLTAFDEPDQLGVSVITRIEILRGRFDSVFKAADGTELLAAQRRLDRDEEFLSALLVIGIDNEVAAAFDRLRGTKALRKIRRGDLLIGSTALAHDATLVTRNRRDFDLVPGLQIENWAD
jgi:tRNA(fMet)-specific endonuclease VapC